MTASVGARLPDANIPHSFQTGSFFRAVAFQRRFHFFLSFNPLQQSQPTNDDFTKSLPRRSDSIAAPTSVRPIPRINSSMATADGEGAALLASQPTTPIAQLDPDLPDQTSRVVRGEITITWPYNSVTKTLAFLLAEPDVRLRRAKGQIRIVLHGPSAKAATDCGLGAGDELLFSLAGADWAKDVSPGRIPGARVDWQLQFNQRLMLQVCANAGLLFVLQSNSPLGQIRRIWPSKAHRHRPPTP